MGVLEFIVAAGLLVLTPITGVKILTKAGYSGWWIALPLSAVVLWILSLALGFDSLFSAIRSHSVLTSPIRSNSFGINTVEVDIAGVLGIIALILYFGSWVMFIVFGFSDWPVLRRQPKGFGGADRLAMAPGPTPGMAPGTPMGHSDLPPPKVQNRGWYQVGATNNDQAYWDGQVWTGRRRWDGAGWVAVPL